MDFTDLLLWVGICLASGFAGTYLLESRAMRKSLDELSEIVDQMRKDLED